MSQWARRLQLPTRSALDIGCAVGGASFELAKTYDRVVGVDRSEAFVSAAKSLTRTLSLSLTLTIALILIPPNPEPLTPNLSPLSPDLTRAR